MIKHVMRITLCSVLFSGLLNLPTSAKTWTSTSGATLEAKLETVKGDTVYLVDESETMISIPISQLSMQDQMYLKSRKGSNIDSVKVLKSVKQGKETDQQIQELDVVLAMHENDQSATIELKVAYVSKGTQSGAKAEFFGIRSKGGVGGYSNGSAHHTLTDELKLGGSIKVGMARFKKTEFVGYRVELIRNGVVVDTKHWEDKSQTAALNKQIQLPANWWYKKADPE